MEVKNEEQLMSAAEAAAYLGLAKGTINNDRYGKRRIPYHRLLNKVVYKRSELDALVMPALIPSK